MFSEHFIDPLDCPKCGGNKHTCAVSISLIPLFVPKPKVAICTTCSVAQVSDGEKQYYAVGLPTKQHASLLASSEVQFPLVLRTLQSLY